jgi:hypothetical protein
MTHTRYTAKFVALIHVPVLGEVTNTAETMTMETVISCRVRCLISFAGHAHTDSETLMKSYAIGVAE